MILSWMLIAIAVTAAASAAALALEGAARALGRPTRAPWVAALAFSTIWPAWLLARAVLPSRAEPATIGTGRLPPVLVSAGRDAIGAVTRYLPTDRRVSAVLLVVWLLITAALFVRLLMGLYSLRRQQRGWPVREVDGVRVRIAPEMGPAVVGVRRPTIVLPEWMLALDPTLRQLVLRHEVEHVRAHDTVLRLLGALLTALMPWNFALWWQADRLALAIEVDCDARVLRAHARRERYGLLLLAIAQRQTTTMLAPALSEPSSHLERRITAMSRSIPRHPMLVAAGLTAAATLALVLACSAPAPDATDTSVATRRASTVTASAKPAYNNGPYHDFQVEKSALLRANNPMPQYPPALERAHVEGEVLVQFVVDTSGRIDVNSLKVLKSTNDQFTLAVRSVLPETRFDAAEVGGRKVRQLIQMPFEFKIPPKSGA
jgi:TonB family protein